ncbi:MAG: ornithine--oxo-acid transaminase [bacterium]|nr:ornithine--oxo-acid transaminase [bacterium]
MEFRRPKPISDRQKDVIAKTAQYSAHHYDSLPVVMHAGKGSKLYDLDGNEYIDMLAGYSVVNFGHGNSRLNEVMLRQMGKGTIFSNVAYNRTYAEFCEELVSFTCIAGRALIMNSGAEAVEKAIKLARKWGYVRKGVERDRAEIIVTNSNFHGRTMGVLSASPVAKYRMGFGPFLPGFVQVPFGSTEHLKEAITLNTVAFLVEPVQGEGGFMFPPAGYFQEVVKLCQANDVLLILDEIPTAFGRTGYNFPHEADGIVPDVLILGKALGGGLVPVSAVVAKEEVISVLGPGHDGSTFGGNPLACAVGSAVLDLIQDNNWAEEASEKGEYFLKKLEELGMTVRGRGLFIGVELTSAYDAHRVCVELLAEGIFTINARRNVVRFTPPFVVSLEEIDYTVEAFRRVLRIT